MEVIAVEVAIDVARNGRVKMKTTLQAKVEVEADIEKHLKCVAVARKTGILTECVSKEEIDMFIAEKGNECINMLEDMSVEEFADYLLSEMFGHAQREKEKYDEHTSKN